MTHYYSTHLSDSQPFVASNIKQANGPPTRQSFAEFLVKHTHTLSLCLRLSVRLSTCWRLWSWLANLKTDCLSDTLSIRIYSTLPWPTTRKYIRRCDLWWSESNNVYRSTGTIWWWRSCGKYCLLVNNISFAFVVFNCLPLYPLMQVFVLVFA